MSARPGRPRGSLGPVCIALLEAAREGPATVRALAARGCLGLAAARYSASRLLAAGLLTADRSRRPWVLRVADPAEPEAHAVAFAFAHLAQWARQRPADPGGELPAEWRAMLAAGRRR